MKPRQILGINLLVIGSVFVGFIIPVVPQDRKTAGSRNSVRTFQNDVLPLLKSNCNPCHFPGGKVYAKLPFDDYKTVVSIGKKLNTRFKQKKQQAVIDLWIDSGGKEN